MRKSTTPGAPKFRSGSVGRAPQKSFRWRTTDGKAHPVTVRRIVVAS